ncbi:MAG: hypothetical protein J5I59_02505 [Saprospiraceae bacterium]|nr:hypothetical protein [Saprospiraceae bacterium]
MEIVILKHDAVGQSNYREDSQFQSGIYTCRYKDEIGQTISGTFIIIN